MTVRIIFAAPPKFTAKTLGAVQKFNSRLKNDSHLPVMHLPLLPAAGATARRGVLISLRMPVRSTIKNRGHVGDRVPPRSEKRCHGGLPAPARMFLDPKKTITGNAPRTPGQHVRPRPACPHAVRRQGKTGNLDAIDIIARSSGKGRRADLSSETLTLHNVIGGRRPLPEAGPCLVDGLGGS